MAGSRNCRMLDTGASIGRALSCSCSCSWCVCAVRCTVHRAMPLLEHQLTAVTTADSDQTARASATATPDAMANRCVANICAPFGAIVVAARGYSMVVRLVPFLPSLCWDDTGTPWRCYIPSAGRWGSGVEEAPAQWSVP